LEIEAQISDRISDFSVVSHEKETADVDLTLGIPWITKTLIR
jgi:hypothetical protein